MSEPQQQARFTPLRVLIWLSVAAASVSLAVIGILGMIVKG
jgi:hypothetical protein